jgi:type I restriction enzyme S subunit
MLLKKPLEEIESRTVGTTVIHLSKTDFDTLKIIIPEDKILEKINPFYENIKNKIVNNSLENIKLSEIRDSLLPKLMSGEIRVRIPESVSP